jgi:hypothetical protein
MPHTLYLETQFLATDFSAFPAIITADADAEGSEAI